MEGHRENHHQEEYLERDEFSFGNRGLDREMNNNHEGGEKMGGGDGKPKTMPPTSVMTRLILIMVWRKLIRNPNTYSSLIGLTWSLVSYRYTLSLSSWIEKKKKNSFFLRIFFFSYFLDIDLRFWIFFTFSFCRWHLEMPAIIAKSISILSDAGLGMAMFSLGQYIYKTPSFFPFYLYLLVIKILSL